MEAPTDNGLNLAGASKRVAQRALVICENRFELLMLEVQEEREQILRAIWFALAAAVFGLLAGIALTGVIILAMWEQHPVIVLLVLTVLYGVAGALLCGRLFRLQRGWQTLPGTLEQLKKDRECLEKNLN